MDDQHKHIEDWLKAAAQQPAPDDTGMEAKQQAWSKMAGLLDNAAVPVPAQEPAPLPKPWFATGQGMLWLAAAAAAVGLLALVVYLQVNRHQTSENKELKGVVHENVAVNEHNGAQKNDTLSMNDPAAGDNRGTIVYGSTESDTMDGDNREAALNGQAEEGINGDDSNGAAAGINSDAGGKGAYGPAAGTGSLVTAVVPQGNKLWSGVTAGAEKGAGEKGRDAGQAAGGGRGAINEKAVQGELSPTTNVTQPDVKESDTALASSNLIAKGSSSERANNNRTAPPINANNKPGSLPADKNSNLAANTPGGNTVNTSMHPYVKAGKVKPGGISGGGSAGKTAPGSVIKATQPSGGNTDAGKTKSGTAAGTGPIPREVTSAGKAKRGLMKSKQASGDVTKEGKAKPGSVIKTDVSGEETTAGKNKPGLAKATESSHPDNANKAQSTIIPIPATPSHTNRQGKTPVTLKNATGMPNTVVLQPLRTVNAFSIHLPTLPLNHREQQISFLTGGFRDPVNYDGPITGGLALQAGFVYPLSVGVAAGDSGTAKPGNGLGFKLGATYAFPIARGLYLQPILSAAYLGGFGKAFSHTAVNRKQETDSLGAATGVFRTDTTTTPYTVKSTFVGGAGVNVAYVINKWIFSTGLTYQYALPSGAKGTPETHTHTDSLQSVPASSTPAFSKQQLPGTHTLSWSLDAGYYIRPRIQVGISYRAILLRSAGNSGFAKPVQPLQDKQLELYIRVPLRK